MDDRKSFQKPVGESQMEKIVAEESEQWSL